jgi:hypothetical protein
MVIKCPECGHQVSDRARVCPSCGIDIAGKVTRCPDCGEYIFKDEHDCPNCHCPINVSAEVPVPVPVPQASQTDVVPVNRGEPEAASVEEKPKNGHKGLWSALIVAFVLALILVFLGIYYYQKTQIQNEQRAYENAMMSREPAVLQNFLDMYIDASVAHRDSIKVHLEALKKIDRDWDNARISESKKTLQLFIERNPDNIHVREAQLLIDSLDFITAKIGNSLESFKKYMEEHEQGYYYDEAKMEYDKMEEEIRLARLKAQQDSIEAERLKAEADPAAPAN